MLKKTIFLLFCLITALCLSACGEKEPNIHTDIYVPTENTVTQATTQTQPTENNIPGAESLPSQGISLPSVPVTIPSVQDTTQADITLPDGHGYTNEYTTDGKPLKIYTVSPYGSYTGEYEQYSYDAFGRVEKISVYRTPEQEQEQAVLVSQTSRTYDGRGYLYATVVQKTASDGSLYTEQESFRTNDSSGQALEISMTVYDENAAVAYTQKTKNTYNERGLLQTEESYYNNTLQTRRDIAYTYENNALAVKTETILYNPDTANSHTETVTTQYNTDGYPVSVSLQGENGSSLTQYTYDSENRESEIRIYDAQGVVSSYITKTYTDLGAGSSMVTEKHFSADGQLYETIETCYDPFGSVFIPG